MYQSNYLVKAFAVLVLTFSWANANAQTDITYSGASCKHAFQGDTPTAQNVQYGSFGGISNHSNQFSLTVTCPIPHVFNADDPHFKFTHNWVYVYYRRSSDASKEARLTCNLIERSPEGDFVQSVTDADVEADNDILNLRLHGIKRHTTLVMECRLPTHGSRILSYRVRSDLIE